MGGSLLLAQEPERRETKELDRLIRSVGRVSRDYQAQVLWLKSVEEPTEEIFEMCREFLSEYREVEREQGRRVAQLWCKIAVSHFELERAIAQRDEAELDENTLKQKILRLIEAEINFEWAELEQLGDEDEVSDLRRELRRRRRNREQEADEWLREVLAELRGDDDEFPMDDDELSLEGLNRKPVLPAKPDSSVVASAAHWDFGKKVLPLLEAACFDCHGADTNEGNLERGESLERSAVG